MVYARSCATIWESVPKFAVVFQEVVPNFLRAKFRPFLVQPPPPPPPVRHAQNNIKMLDIVTQKLKKVSVDSWPPSINRQLPSVNRQPPPAVGQPPVRRSLTSGAQSRTKKEALSFNTAPRRTLFCVVPSDRHRVLHADAEGKSAEAGAKYHPFPSFMRGPFRFSQCWWAGGHLQVREGGEGGSFPKGLFKGGPEWYWGGGGELGMA